MGSLIILVAAGVLACWLLLGILANERQRQVHDFEIAQQAARAHHAALIAEAATRKAQSATTTRQSAR